MTDPVPTSAASAHKETIFCGSPPVLDHPLNPPGEQIAISQVLARETGKAPPPIVTPPKPSRPANDAGPAPATLAPPAPAYELLPRGLHADWRLGARMVVEGRRLDEIARALRVTRQKVERNLRRSFRFRCMIEEERQSRREADALRFRSLQSDVVDRLAEAIRAGDPRLLLWAAKELNLRSGWPPALVGDFVQITRSSPASISPDPIAEDGGDVPETADAPAAGGRNVRKRPESSGNAPNRRESPGFGGNVSKRHGMSPDDTPPGNEPAKNP